MWYNQKTGVSAAIITDEYFCSACRGFAKRAYAFCPNCGSRMTAVQEDDSEEWDELDEIEFLLEEEEDEW